MVLGASILLAAWLVLRVAPWSVRRATVLHGRADLSALTLERAEAAIAAHPVVRDSLAARARRLVALAPRLLDGATPAEAGASLAALVTGAAATRQVRIVRQEVRPDSAASLFQRVVMRLEAEGDIAGIGGWLAELEEGTSLIRVRSLAVTALEPAAASSQTERLRADLVVEGWAMNRGESRQ